MQLQFENCIRLNSREWLVRIQLGSAPTDVDVDFLSAEIRDQVFARVRTVRAAANNGDDVVQVIERGQIAFENVLAVFRLLQQVGGAPPHYIHAMIDEMQDGLNQAHFFRLSIDHSQEDHRKTFLHGSVLEQLIENDLRLSPALKLNHNAHAVPVRLITDVTYVVDDLVVY